MRRSRRESRGSFLGSQEVGQEGLLTLPFALPGSLAQGVALNAKLQLQLPQQVLNLQLTHLVVSLLGLNREHTLPVEELNTKNWTSPGCLLQTSGLSRRKFLC